jgi:hypothetical protein
VAAVGVAGGVEVVFKKVDVGVDAFGFEGLFGLGGEVVDDFVAGPVVGDELGEVVAFGGGDFGVGSDVEVEAGCVVGEDVGAAPLVVDGAEEDAGDFVGAEGVVGSAGGGGGDAVFGFYAHDAAGVGHLLAAFLDVGADEVFGVGFKEAVDFVEEVVDAGGVDVGLATGGGFGGGGVVVVVVGGVDVGLWHVSSPFHCC